MPARSESPRTRRVADRIVVELAEILAQKTEDPRLRALTVTAARVSRDLSAARVWVSGRLEPGEDRDVLAALEHAAPYFRTLLAPRLGLRVVPTIRFEIDRTLEAGARIEELLREIHETAKADEPGAPGEPAGGTRGADEAGGADADAGAADDPDAKDRGDG